MFYTTAAFTGSDCTYSQSRGRLVGEDIMEDETVLRPFPCSGLTQVGLRVNVKKCVVVPRSYPRHKQLVEG